MIDISIEEQKQCYDTFWDTKKKSLCIDEKCREEFIISIFKKINRKEGKELNILDLGCGRGWLTNILSEYGNVVGVDLSVKTAKKLFPDLKFIEADICRSETFGEYDVIVSSDVIEHLITKDQEIYIKNINRMLKPSGYLILTTPNKPVEEKHLKNMGNIRLQPIENWFDQEALIAKLTIYFKIDFIGSTMFYPFFIQQHRVLNMIYLLFYNKFSFYKIVNKSLKSTFYGKYLTIIVHRI